MQTLPRSPRTRHIIHTVHHTRQGGHVTTCVITPCGYHTTFAVFEGKPNGGERTSNRKTRVNQRSDLPCNGTIQRFDVLVYLWNTAKAELCSVRVRTLPNMTSGAPASPTAITVTSRPPLVVAAHVEIEMQKMKVAHY